MKKQGRVEGSFSEGARQDAFSQIGPRGVRSIAM